jgi:hypothetical protein
MRFGQDNRVAVLSYRSLALWLLGSPEAALADTRQALSDAREIGQASTLMYNTLSRIDDALTDLDKPSPRAAATKLPPSTTRTNMRIPASSSMRLCAI